MVPTFLELLPEELETIPIWDTVLDTNTTNTTNTTAKLVNKLVKGGRHCATPQLVGGGRPAGRCCLGAISNGGEQNYMGALKACPQNSTVYQRVRDLAVLELEAHPIAAAKHQAKQGCDVCRIVGILAQLPHQKFAFLGDSIQSQAFTAFECELRRRGFDVSAGPTKDWPTKGGRWRYGIKMEYCITVKVPEEDDDRSVDFCFYKHYRPIEDMEEYMALAKSHDVLMINYGLHFLPSKREKPKLQQSLEAFLEKLVVNATRTSGGTATAHVLYRETSAQHFDNDGGEYQKRKRKRAKSKLCRPLSKTDMLARWRQGVFLEAANRTGVFVVKALHRKLDKHHAPKPEVAFLPFWDFTSNLYDLHNGEDCTHYCYTPHTFYPLWRHIRIALDNVVDNVIDNVIDNVDSSESAMQRPNRTQ